MDGQTDFAPDHRHRGGAPSDAVQTTGPLPPFPRRRAIRAGVALAAGGGLAAGRAGSSTLGAASPFGPVPSVHPARQDAATPEPLPPPSAGSRTATLAEELRTPEF